MSLLPLSEMRMLTDFTTSEALSHSSIFDSTTKKTIMNFEVLNHPQIERL